jgi:outer membrane protein assembly factor BamD (BamD/ComL family)
MRLTRTIACFVLILTACGAQAQLGYDLTIKKPEPYDNRELKAEKTGDKKLSAPKKFLQNNFTHFNYFFNANQRLNDIVEQAKANFKDDYSELLLFYNYSLDATAANKNLLDSVIFKSQTGIVLHDLRNDWIDNMYMLWGMAYYLEKEFDSAHQMFQFINWAFAEKEKDGYYRFIGSRMDGNNALSISTEEKTNVLKKVFSEPPSRNDAFVWMVRTMIQKNQLAEAGTLIATLKKDPLFPKRLNGALDEVTAFWFYEQKIWDSSAQHLMNALDEATTKGEKARWEYLIAQMLERSGKPTEAEKFYARALSHTTDPVLEVYARLNLIRTHKDDTEKYIDNNIAALAKMAKRDKYEEYRDVIYAMAAQMELERGNSDAAQEFLLKGSKYQNNNTASSNKAFIQLADLFYKQHKYLQAANFYDSVRIENLETVEAERITTRKRALEGFRTQQAIYDRQDSLQRVANMPEAERNAFVKKLVRQLRKQQGLKDESGPVTGGSGFAANTYVDPFSAQNQKGEWYFYNDALKARGAAEFKQVWGNRPNVDNWRRFTDVTAQLRNTSINNQRGNNASATVTPTDELTTEALLAKLPLTEQSLQNSNDSLMKAMFALGNIYINDLEDYEAAINIYEQLLQRFPYFTDSDKALFDLYYAYNKIGNKQKAEQAKALLNQKQPNGRYATIIATGNDPQSKRPNTEVTKVYEGIYDLFLEGKFEEAEAAKRQADSTYKTNYWSAQLLYIEAVYYAKQREDSLAKDALNKLINQSSNSNLSAKATTLLDVLNRRRQIEDELTALQIQRPAEDSIAIVTPPSAVNKPMVRDTVVKNNVVTNPVIKQPAVKDTVAAKPTIKPPSIYTYKPEKPHLVAILLNKVDVVFGNEAKNAFFRWNRTAYYNQTFNLNLVDLNPDYKLLLIGDFATAQAALDYVQKAKPISATEIIPWLKGDKYSFAIISPENLEILKSNPDISKYKQFLEQNLPGKF